MRIAPFRRGVAGLAAALGALVAAPAGAQKLPEPTPQPTPMPVMPPIPAAPQPPPGAEPSQPPAAPAQPPEGPARPPSVAEPVPAPPPPGQKTTAPAPPPAMPPLPLLGPIDDERARGSLAGWHDGFFLRDAGDRFRLYPGGRLQIDLHSFLGAGVSNVAARGGGTALQPRLLVRRARIELGGEVLQRFQFSMGVEFGGQPLVNANGRTQVAAAPAGEDPTSETARFAAVQSTGAVASLDDAWINYRVCPCLNFMLGQQRTPFSLEARTSTDSLTRPERSLAVRFAVPSPREIGLGVWGDLGADRLVSYELGIYGGDGQNRPQVDNRVDFIGRIFTRPLSGGSSSLKRMQIGVSARHGQRDPSYVGYDYVDVVTGQGFALWQPRYVDSIGRTIHVLPSGAQNAIGGELRLPFSRVEFRGEAYWVSNATREAVEGFQLTNTERLGRMKGLGWYAQLSGWALGDAYVNGDPGLVRPRSIDLSKKIETKKGLELYAVAGGVHATYDGASREPGEFEPLTPGSPGTATGVVVLEYGVGATYWYTRHVRATLAWTTYHVPNSLSTDNLAIVAGNVADPPERDSHFMHELGTRLGVSF